MNGQIRVKGSYTKGREDGEWIYWYQNGEKMIEAEIDGQGELGKDDFISERRK